MPILESLTARLPFTKKTEKLEYFFALNIGPEKLTVGLWTIEEGKLKVISTSQENYSTQSEIVAVVDKLLDNVLGTQEAEPSKILFGVQDSWLLDDDLKEPYLKLLREIVKELELTPMAYVATSHALVHFLEKADGAPLTAILVGIGKKFVTVNGVRAGKMESGVSLERGSNLGESLEKGILSSINAEVLPSRILLYSTEDSDLTKQKAELLSYPWMSKLSFLHFPKIEVLSANLEVNAICLAGAVEIEKNVKVDKQMISGSLPEDKLTTTFVEEKIEDIDKEVKDKVPKKVIENEDFGFVAGDITAQKIAEKEATSNILDTEGDLIGEEEEVLEDEIPEKDQKLVPTESVVMSPEKPVDFVLDSNVGHILKKISLPRGSRKFGLGIILVLAILAAGYVFIPKAKVFVYVEPRILEKDTQVIADPNIKTVNEDGKKIPAVLIDTQISGSGKASATGKKQVGDLAKGVVRIYNGTDSSKNFPAGTILMGSDGLKFTLSSSVQVASRSASESDPLSTISGKSDPISVTALSIGPDSNIPSGVNLTVGSLAQSQVVAKTEGNFSGGTSKDVTVVTSDDQQKLLAQVSADLKSKAREQLQSKLDTTEPGKKVLEETIAENITKKTYGKNINDQASDFSLDLTVSYKGTAFSDTDLKTIVAKLVETDVPDGFSLNLGDAQTQSAVSKIEKDGSVDFIAKFKAKLMPKIDANKIRKQIIGKTPQQAADILRTYEDVLGSEIKINPSLPGVLARLPIWEKNITVSVGLK